MTEIALEKRYSTARQALTALESKQTQPLSSNKYSTLRKIPKPAGTYIQLNKSVEQLEIHVPAPGLRKLTTYGTLGVVFYIILWSIALSVAIGGLSAMVFAETLIISAFGKIILVAFLAFLVICIARVLGEKTIFTLTKTILN